MDVHAPHEPIHGFKDFLLHLLTITIGLLIAVGIEGLVERRHEHVLVAEARGMMREEILHNANIMKDAVTAISSERASVANDIAVLQRIAADPGDKAAQDASITADFSMKTTRDTAWKTAQGTNALSFMPYDEAQRYAEVYGELADFQTRQSTIEEDEARFLGVVAKTSYGDHHVTADQAQQALLVFGEWQTHLAYLEIAAKVSYEDASAFLAGREGPTSMHMNLGDK